MPHVGKVLIVDDDQRMVESLRTLLSRKGYELKTSDNTKKAIDYLEKNDFDLVLLDIIISDENGYKVMDHVIRQALDALVIIITGHASTESAIEALRKGAYDYIRKPFEPEELLTTVKNALNQQMLKKDRELAQKALRESEVTYRELVENLNEVIYSVNKDGVMTYVNPPIETILGYTPSEIIGKPFQNFVYEEDLPLMRKRFQQILAGDIKPSEYRILNKNGEINWIRASSEPTFEGDRPIGLKGVIIDINDRKLAEEALRESEERFRLLSESAFEAIVIHEEGILIEANARFFKMFGYKPHELLGNQVIPLIVAPESIEFMREQISAGATTPYDSVGIRKDGTRFPMEIHARPIEYQGRRVRVGAIRDLSDRKQTEEALRESEERFKTLTSNLNVGVYRNTTDPRGKFIEANPAIVKMFGYDTRAEFMGVAVSDLYQNPDKRKDFNTKILRDGAVISEELQLRKKDGTSFIGSVSAVAIKDKDGNVKYYDGIIEDVTESILLETQLQQAQKMEAIGTLAGGIAHDFNNLLMGIQGRTSLMMADTDSFDSNLEHLKGMEEHVKSAADLTKQLLAFARGGKYEVKPTDLNELVTNQNRMFGRTRKEITIRGKYETNLWTVEVDPSQIEQVLLNLYVNAWQAMPDGGDLFIQTENVRIGGNYTRPYHVKPGKYVKISVIDAGVGMDEATCQRIFDPFFSTKEMGRGTGLGLASAYGIIKNHGGFIDVYSEKDAGSTFEIYLPASEKQITDEKGLSKSIRKGSETVLLVDDESLIIDVGKQLLKKLGYNILTAEDGKEAIEIYKKNEQEIDLVLLDMIMPGVGGGEIYDRLKKINSKIKVLLSSGYSIEGQATRILERGCDGFIQKPFNMKDLSQKIREILDKK